MNMSEQPTVELAERGALSLPHFAALKVVLNDITLLHAEICETWTKAWAKFFVNQPMLTTEVEDL